jgi:hypothetical protein
MAQCLINRERGLYFTLHLLCRRHRPTGYVPYQLSLLATFRYPSSEGSYPAGYCTGNALDFNSGGVRLESRL